jgi:hypothetical protein
MRIIAEPLPYWIPPNVTGNILDDLLRAQNVIVIAHLPEPPAMSLLEFIRGALFEGVDELNQAGGVRESFTEEMKVVRHDAIGVKREIPLSGSFQEITEQPFPRGLILEKGRAPLGPNSHEINAATAVVFRRTAKTFLKKRHADKVNTQWMLRKKSWAEARPPLRQMASGAPMWGLQGWCGERLVFVEAGL